MSAFDAEEFREIPCSPRRSVFALLLTRALLLHALA